MNKPGANSPAVELAGMLLMKRFDGNVSDGNPTSHRAFNPLA